MKDEAKREFSKRPRDTEPEKGEIKIRFRVDGKELKSEIATHIGDREAEIFLALAAALKQLASDNGVTTEQLGLWFTAYLMHDEEGLRALLEPVDLNKATS